MTDSTLYAGRRLVLLGMLLQMLHVLFGVTAVIGMLVTQMSIKSTQGTVYYSQLKWQFITFWIGLAGYVVAFYLWLSHQFVWGFGIVFAVVTYRLWISVWHWQNRTPVTRLI